MESRRLINIIQLLSDLGANPAKQGAAYGPAALCEYDGNQKNLLSSFKKLSIEVPETFARPETEFSFAKYIDIIGRHQLNARNQISGVIEGGFFPLVLSGDHSNAAIAIAAIKGQNPNKKVGVVWIDAHADIHTPYTTPSGNMHGMPVAISLGIDNNIYHKNQPSDIEIYWWEQLKKQNGLAENSISPRDIAFVGIRDLEKEEWDYIKTEHIKYYVPEDIKNLGIELIYQNIIAYFGDYDLLYVSFDIDSIDSKFVPGTGTPVAEGLSLEQAGGLLYLLWNNPKLCGLEIAEINPQIESVITLKSVYNVLETMFNNKG